METFHGSRPLLGARRRLLVGVSVVGVPQCVVQPPARSPHAQGCNFLGNVEKFFSMEGIKKGIESFAETARNTKPSRCTALRQIPRPLLAVSRRSSW